MELLDDNNAGGRGDDYDIYDKNVCDRGYHSLERNRYDNNNNDNGNNNIDDKYDDYCDRNNSRDNGMENNKDINGSHRRSNSRQRNEDTSGRSAGASESIYVTNVPVRCTEKDIRRVFEEIAPVKDCHIVTNPVTRESRGFAFVSFIDSSFVEVAIDRLDRQVYIGDAAKPLRIERAKRNAPHNPTPGYYKGPAGASIKYDKSGRLRPGFLPYYAVAPGSSRVFMPNGMVPYPDHYGGRMGRNHGGRWADDRDYGPRGYEGSRYLSRVGYEPLGGRNAMYDDRGAPGSHYDMRMERGYEGRSYDLKDNAFDNRGYDRAPNDGDRGYNRGATGMEPRGYDRGHYDDSRYAGNYDNHLNHGYDCGGEGRYERARERSRSRGRRERRRSASVSPRYHRGRR